MNRYGAEVGGEPVASSARGGDQVPDTDLLTYDLQRVTGEKPCQGT